MQIWKQDGVLWPYDNVSGHICKLRLKNAHELLYVRKVPQHVGVNDWDINRVDSCTKA